MFGEGVLARIPGRRRAARHANHVDEGAQRGGRLSAKYVGAPTTATFIGPITWTAIISAAARSRVPIPASNPFATISIGASSTLTSRWTSGYVDRKRSQTGAITVAAAR